METKYSEMWPCAAHLRASKEGFILEFCVGLVDADPSQKEATKSEEVSPCKLQFAQIDEWSGFCRGRRPPHASP